MSAYSDLILATTGLLSYWRLGESSGNALDSKGSNPATAAGGITRAVTGLITNDADKAVQGDGLSSSRVTAPGHSSMESLNTLTVECWVKPSVITASRRIVSRSSGTMLWMIGVSGASGYYFQIQDNSATLMYALSNSSPYMPVAGRTDHLVGVYTSSGTLKLYVNGVAIPNAPSATPSRPLMAGAGVPLDIFADSSSASGINGVIDEVAIYNVALTPAQILQHYNTGIGLVSANDTPSGTLALSGSVVESWTGIPRVYYDAVIQATPGLVSYWRMDTPSGSVVDSKDSNHGSVAGVGLTRSVAGLLTSDPNQAMQGDGSQNSYVTIPDSANMDVGARLSVECWVKPSALAGNTLYPIGKAPLSSWAIRNYSDRRWEFSVVDANGVITTVVVATPLASTNTRQQLVLTYDSVAGQMKAYIDGVAYGAQSRAPNANVKVLANPIRLFNAAGGVTDGFPGVIDEVSFYNVALTPQQVADHYQAGALTRPMGGTIVLSGSVVESYVQPPGYDRPTATLPLSGICNDVYVIARSWGGLVRELPPLRHHVDLIAPSSRHYRWANDEPDAQNVPMNLRWGSTMPGGYDTGECVLPRKPGVDYADLERLSTFRVIGPGGKVVGEYRLERTPQTSGDQMAISPSAVGWQAHLTDNKNVNIIFIDREHSGWVGPNSQRRLALLTSSIDPLDGRSTQAEDGLPSLILGTQGAWSRRFNCESYYFMPSGDAVSRVKFDFTTAASVAIGDANWVGDVHAVTKDGFTTFTQLVADWLSAVSGSVNADASAVAIGNRRAIMLRVYYGTGPAGADNVQYDVFLRHPRVFGNHNLPIRGATSQTEGFLASDMIAYAVSTWAPLLKVTSDSIQATNFIVPQAAFRDTTVSDIVNQSTRFGLEDWAVWNDRTLYLSRRNESPLGRKWRARIGPAKLEETGKQADRLWESVIVEFNDVDGSQKTVGPPGSGADVEDSRLKDLDPDNPANKLGMTRRDKLVMGVSTTSGAIEVGRRFLEEQKLIDRSGRATLVGHVEDNHGVIFPFSDVQAGDAITFVDANDTSYRRIVKADHDDSSKAVSVDLDAPPEGLQAVLERLQVVLVPLGL